MHYHSTAALKDHEDHAVWNWQANQPLIHPEPESSALACCWSPNQTFQVLHIPFVRSHFSFHRTAREASGNALHKVLRENWRLTIRTEWSVAYASPEENRTEKNTVT
jgi:hypothetical protein